MSENLNRDELEKLLPWYVNGTLQGEEKNAVEAFVEHDEGAQSQVEFLRKIRKTVKQDASGSPGVFGLQRLNSLISDQSKSKQDQAPQSSVVSSSRWKIAAAVAGFVVMIQAGLLFNTWDAPQYTPLSVDSDTQLLQVIFNENATERDIRSLLQSVGATISSGPGALGIYRLELDLQQNEADIDTLLERLLAEPNVVSEASLD